MLWWVTTRSTTVMTSSGGMIASALSVIEAMQTSRIDRFSRNTRPISQPSVNGLSASATARLVRISSTSPSQTSAKRSSSTGTGSLYEVGVRVAQPDHVPGGVRRDHQRRGAVACIRITTGGGGLDDALQLEQRTPPDPVRLGVAARIHAPRRPARPGTARPRRPPAGNRPAAARRHGGGPPRRRPGCGRRRRSPRRRSSTGSRRGTGIASLEEPSPGLL